MELLEEYAAIADITKFVVINNRIILALMEFKTFLFIITSPWAFLCRIKGKPYNGSGRHRNALLICSII